PYIVFNSKEVIHIVFTITLVLMISIKKVAPRFLSPSLFSLAWTINRSPFICDICFISSAFMVYGGNIFNMHHHLSTSTNTTFINIYGKSFKLLHDIAWVSTFPIYRIRSHATESYSNYLTIQYHFLQQITQ
ncbi:hypothetical protein ACJX0J_008133, partial [Zea mays]